MVLCQSPEGIQQEVMSIVILHCSGLLCVVMDLCQSPEGIQQEVMPIVHCSGLLCVVACSEVDAEVEAHLFLLCL